MWSTDTQSCTRIVRVKYASAKELGTLFYFIIFNRNEYTKTSIWYQKEQSCIHYGCNRERVPKNEIIRIISGERIHTYLPNNEESPEGVRSVAEEQPALRVGEHAAGVVIRGNTLPRSRSLPSAPREPGLYMT